VRERYFSIIADCLREIVRYANADISILRAAELHAFSIDSTREEIGRSFIASYGAIGRPEEARRVYETLSRALKLDGIDAPVPETRAAAVRATTHVLENKNERRTVRERRRYFAEAIPRVALLAPRWVEAGADSQNFHRSLIEDIANELARYRTLVAIAPHSSFQVKDDGGLVARNDVLRADYSLSSLVRPGEGLGVLSARLVDTASAAIVWAEEFPLQHENIIGSSRLLIARIAAEVSGAIESDSFRRLERTDNPSSYLMFLRGQRALNMSDLRSVRRARKAFRAAIAEDDDFSEAYSGLSCSLYLEWILLGGRDPRLLADARELAEAAILRDPASSAGYWRKADVLLYQHDFDGSEECFQRASALHPNSADILLDHGDALGHIGDANQAWGMFERAIELNPTPPDFYWWVGASIAFSQAQYQKAIDLCSNFQNDEPALRLLAATHGQLGNSALAREYGRRVTEAYPDQTAEEMARLQPHRSMQQLQPFIEGLRLAGVK
jgi:tetratricopeptide (TPR) repeat protein